MHRLRLLFQDESLVAVDKPAGIYVHPPEDETQRIAPRSSALHVVSRQTGRFLYPVHRLDRATSGVLVFALNVGAARGLAEAFAQRRVRKTYYCVARGWIEGPCLIDRALKPESGDGPELPSQTAITPLARVELPLPGGRYATSRYTLLKAEPRTGRFHQIRRHLAGAAHPLIGDAMHGHGPHNRNFRDALGIPGLLLKAQALELPHPETGAPLRFQSRWEGRWHRVFELFGVCPWAM